MGIEGLKVAEINSKVSPYWSVSVVEETESTQIDCALDFTPGKVLVAEFQSAGRGRLDRKFLVPPRKGLTFSICLPNLGNPENLGNNENLGWIPLLVGLACSKAINRHLTEPKVEIKWPNDLLIENRKLGGILSEKIESGLIVGIGINIFQSQDELPIKEAISLSMISKVDRSDLLIEILSELQETLGKFEQAKGDYVANCATIGRQVLVTLPNGEHIEDVAKGIGRDGSLLIAEREISAADILHLR